MGKQSIVTIVITLMGSVKVSILTRPLKEFHEEKRPGLNEIVTLLQNSGITVLLKPGIHQKFAIIDSKIVWFGSINYLDTAWPYHGGDSEQQLGEALKNGHRDKAFAATKLPSWMVKSRSHMDEFLDQQCKNLGTDPIDFYLIHNLAGPMWERLKKMLNM